MKRRPLKSLLASIAVMAMLICCLLPGLVLPVAAADVTYSQHALSVPNVWIMTGEGRYRMMKGVVHPSNYSSGSNLTIAGSEMTWSIADTSIATIDATGKLLPVKVGETTLTGTFPTAYNTSAGVVSKTIKVHVVDGSDYVYFDPDYTVGDNVITNGDFESGYIEKNWTKYQNNLAPSGTTAATAAATDIVSGIGKDGGYGLQLLSGVSWESPTLGSAKLKPGTATFILSFDYKANPGNAFSIYGGNLSIPSTDFTLSSTAGGEWRTYTKVFKAPIITSGARKMYFTPKTINAENPVVIDNVSIREYNSSVEVEQFLLNHSEKMLMIGQTLRVEAMTEPFGGNLNDIVWSSDNEKVATAAAANGKQPSNDPRIMYGIITAVGEGTATITATLPNGMTASCEITVKAGLGSGLLADPECDKANKKQWETVPGVNIRYDADGGVNGTSALIVDRAYPVRQKFVGLKPNKTYTLQGIANVTENGYLVINVVNGGEVIATLTEQYSSGWNTLADGSSSKLNGGFTFTTPAALASDTTELHIAVLNAADDTAATLVADKAAGSGSGNVEWGDGDGVYDDNDDIDNPFTALIDSVDVFEAKIENVDLTPTYVQWKGDADNNGQVTPGTAITFEVPVKNIGTGDLPAGKTFTIDIAANREVIRTITYNGGIKAGETVVITDSEAWTAVAGDYMISAHVNAGLDFPETNLTTNQTYQLNLRVANDVYVPAYNKDIIDHAGMDRLTMSDDFNDLSTVDTLGGGDEGYKWYITRPWSADRLTPYDYKTENGILTLHAEVPTYGIAFNSVDVATNNGYRYKQGYLEVRLRIVRPSPNDNHESGVPTVWSFTEDKALEAITGTDKNWVELDWLEYWGNTNQYPGGYYTTTFHQSTTEEETPSYSNSNHSLEALGDAEWHVMGWLWEHNKIRTFVDGVEMMNLFIDKDAPLVPGARVNKTDAEGNKIGSSNDPGLFSWANMEEAVLYLGGSKDNPHEIDYVRIWQTGEPETVSDNMTMDKTTVTMSEKTRETLNVTVPNGEDAGTLTWASSDPKVVTVHGNGELYARGAGKATVTATNANGLSVMCTVNVTHNLWVGGDCEETNDLLHKSWDSLLAGTGYDIVDDGTGNHAYKMPYSSTTVRYLNNWPVKKSTTYVLTGRYKGPGTMYAYFNSAYTVKSGDIALTKTGTVDGWTNFSIEFTTKDATLNSYYVLGFRNKYSSSKEVYLDDLVLVEKANAAQSTYTLSVDSMTGGSVSLKANGSAISSGASVAPGTYVDVTVAPSSGNQLSLGSLEYTYTTPAGNGNKTFTREILNKNSTEFGAGDGKTFRFVMPAGNTTLSAAFESAAAADQDPVATLGTSVFLHEETNAISGIRFLNRLYYTRMEGDDVYVMYNGTEHKVAQFGSLLKRGTNVDGELTLEAYEEHKNDASATRVWKANCYAGRNIAAVDYTNGYIDFTIIMTSSVANRYAFLSREYTTCAYVVLDDGTTIYTDAFTDSVLGAENRR